MYGDKIGADRVLMGKREGKTTWEDLGVDGRIILNWFLMKGWPG